MENYLAKIDRMIEIHSKKSYPAKDQTDLKKEFNEKFQRFQKEGLLVCPSNFDNDSGNIPSLNYITCFKNLHDLLLKMAKQNDKDHVCLYQIGVWFNNNVRKAYWTCWDLMKSEISDYCDKKIEDISHELAQTNIRVYQKELDKLWDLKYKILDVIESMNDLSTEVPDSLKEKLAENDSKIAKLEELIKNEPSDDSNFSIRREFVIWNRKKCNLLNKVVPNEFVRIFEEKLNFLFPYRELSKMIISRCNNILGLSEDETNTPYGECNPFLHIKGISSDSDCELQDFYINMKRVKKDYSIVPWLC